MRDCVSEAGLVLLERARVLELVLVILLDAEAGPHGASTGRHRPRSAWKEGKERRERRMRGEERGGERREERGGEDRGGVSRGARGG